ATLASAMAAVPRAEVDAGAGGELPPVADLMAATGIVASKSAARRAIAEGGAYLNNEKVIAEDAVPGPDDLLHGEFLVLRRGSWPGRAGGKAFSNSYLPMAGCRDRLTAV